MKYIPIIELPILILLVVIRALILRRQGIKALVFGVTDKSDFIMMPVIFCFLYALLSTVFDLPFPYLLKRCFWETNFLDWPAIILCTCSLIWFAVALKTFGKSFRVGIDEKTKEKLITNGPFSISRNPIYVAFLTFFLGIFFVFPNISTSLFFILFFTTIHRQILREEKFLKNHYGKEYEDYCIRTRRYL